MALRAAVLVALGIVGERRPGRRRSVRCSKSGSGHVGPDAGVLDGDDVLGGAVLGIAGDLVRPDLPAEADPPQQIAHRLVLHDVGRGDEGGEDDAALAAIDDVVVVVAEADRAPVPHRGGIGIGGADAEVAGAPVAARGRDGSDRAAAPPAAARADRPRRARVSGSIGSGTMPARQVGVGLRCIVVGLVREQIGHVRRGVVVEAGDEGRDAGVGLDLRGIEVELPAPDQARLLAQIDDLLEEALEDVDAEPLPDAGQAGVVGQRPRRGRSPGTSGGPG